MKTIQKILLVCACASLSGVAIGGEQGPDDSYVAVAEYAASPKGCSLRNVVGKWLFATSIGRQMFPGFPTDKDLTAMGTMEIRRDGTLSGRFDLTVQDFSHFPSVGYDGTIVINSDCTGTLMFVNEFGATRTDSIAIVGRNEFLGMSQDPANLWTYEVRRVGAYSRR